MDWIFNRVRAIEARRELTEFWAKENRPVSPYNYETRPFAGLSDIEIAECSNLYSHHYGIYNEEAIPERVGHRIILSVNRYVTTYKSYPSAMIALCKTKEMEIVGFAIYIPGELTKGRKFCWVTQLVVHGDHRQKGIGTKLLESAWCFSDYSIRGLATANAITLRTLENVTWRKIDAVEIKGRKDEVLQLLRKVPYMNGCELAIDNGVCQINSDFCPVQEDSNMEDKFRVYADKLGEIRRGHEWLGLVFNEQSVVYDVKRFAEYVRFSEEKVFEAFSRVYPDLEYLNAGAQKEIMDLAELIPNFNKNMRVLDLGCGKGRHCIELAKRGFTDVLGVDKLEAAIENAEGTAVEYKYNDLRFKIADVRTFTRYGKYDLVLCLYDVIGTYRSDNDNDMILETIWRNLRTGGIAVITVMNMRLTEMIAGENRFSISAEPERLLNLPATKNMQRTGNVFHKDIIINTDDGLVYRKEQFEDANRLNAEYVITDRRYTKEEFAEKLRRYGFKVLHSRFVRAKHFGEALTETDKHAKEILFVVKKEYKLF